MKTGILLINLGTPDSPSTSNVRTYLTEFLNDRRVIDINAIGRFLLVNGIIIPFRAPKSSKLYKEIWTDDGSPIMIYSKGITEKVRNLLDKDKYEVALAMRYRKPSIPEALEQMRKAMVSKIVVLPLYPQYASSSTGSTIEKVMDTIKSWEIIPEMHILNHFYDNEQIINGYVENAQQYNLKDYDHVLFSYHGLPERQIIKGSKHYGNDICELGKCCDTINLRNQFCYRANCAQTTRSIVEKLGIDKAQYTMTFQSRLGKTPWVKPYTDKVLESLAKQGKKKILVFSPAFVADCLETINEISVEYQEMFKEWGGEKLQLVESLNTSDGFAKAIVEMTTKY
jgi:protoporphyrin/coproporphyrin ferrochelatase